jgi:hypothetical protein
MTIALITGVPRSGTSLVCACLNTAPDCVALVEPMDVPFHGDGPRAVEEVVRFAQDMRASIVTHGVARSVTSDGAIPDNTFEEVKADGGLRHARSRVASVTIDKPLTSRFRLFIKHPALFTVLARPLQAHLPLYAVVRHPLASLASWQTVDTSLREGRWPVAEAFAPDLREALDRVATPLARQIVLLQWILRVYRQLPDDRIVRYETVVQDPGLALAPLSGSVTSLTHPVRKTDPRARYPQVDLAVLSEALLTIAADIEPFYPDFRASVRSFP